MGALLWLSQRTARHCVRGRGHGIGLHQATFDGIVRMARRVLAYLNETKTHRLHYFKSELPYSELVKYTDASFAPQGEKSVGAAVVLFQGCAVAWRTGKQKMIATSSAEAELQASTEGAHMMISIEAVLIDMGIEVDGKRLLVDNTAAITLASQDNALWRTRHLKLRVNWLRERVQEGDFEPQHCRGEDQLADVITKVVPSRRMEDMMKRWGMGAKNSDLRSVEIPATDVEDESMLSPHGDGYPDVNDIVGDTLDIMRVDEPRRGELRWGEEGAAAAGHYAPITTSTTCRAPAFTIAAAGHNTTFTISTTAPASHPFANDTAAAGLVSKARGPL